MSSVRPYNWIQEIETALVQLDEKPQFKLPSSLDWQNCEEALKKLFDTQELTLSHASKGWATSSQALAGFGGKRFLMEIVWSPLQAPCFFLTDSENLQSLMASIFFSEEAANFFLSSSYMEGFYHYLVAEMLHIIGSQGFAAPLVPRLGSQKQDLPSEEEACFMIDLHLAIRGKDVWGRILLSESFKKEWKAFFAHLPPPNLSEEMKSKITTQVSLEIGYCRLNLEEWGKVKEGDFILLDRCSYDPEMQKGNVILALQGKPLFRGRFKENEIKITGYPVYEEVSDAMEEGSFRNRFESDEDEDEDLYEDFDDEDDSEFEEDEEDIFAGLEPRQEAPQKEKVVERKPAQLAPEEETTSLSPTDLPLHLTIEVGRILMTAGALMSLAPGNLLELNVSPEQGVDLVINGKKVGRGELIRMGDVLGVRILSL